jgi:hypothetical protein
MFPHRVCTFAVIFWVATHVVLYQLSTRALVELCLKLGDVWGSVGESMFGASLEHFNFYCRRGVQSLNHALALSSVMSSRASVMA